MAVTHWYFLLLPLVVLAVMSLLRFRGCSFQTGGIPGQPDVYGTAVKANNPTAWFRLEELIGPTAQNEEGPPNGTYSTASSPLSAGNSLWHSQAVPTTALKFAINNPSLVPLESQDPFDFSVRFQGSQVVANVPALLNATEFTLEALVFADWDLTVLGNYYCVMELAGIPHPATNVKGAGFGLYAGPSDTTNPNSPYSWQAWMGNGDTFYRLEEVKPYTPNDPANPNPGPNVEKDDATYLAFTFSQPLGQAFLFLFTQDRDLDYVAYQLTPLTYAPVVAGMASQGLQIGATAQGPLFTPPAPTPIPVLYPFIGQMANVAIYNNQVLTESQLRQHAIAAFFLNSPST
ncbi:MAG: hypothetical protein ABR902_05735 [Candidatus Korobacteraceae bacterium]|jgi:hypothetical protein